ncbi:hypothetical protein OM076_20145 [Solirubrobacter ginsenosidimutans]|uniref:SbsA Ig-like domain-containing protein n=1 Tax=Solirubrobacter ginsenosidimutans TaxID=490573 RepID=A0A9X3MVM1_9ACTN|nr:hypothetical protein [Solirubrobacter ginsenosidimutans]MDA0162596.1 hypothetical protein [Solirubrobacter ginsenosidimutans]
MTMRRYAVTLTIVIALLITAIAVATSGSRDMAQAADKTATATATATATPDSSKTSDSSTSDDDSTWGDSSSSSTDDSSSDDSEGSIGSNGSDNGGGTVLDGVGDTENVDAGNRLSSAKVLRQNVNDSEEEYTRYCFKDGIQSLNKGEASQFAVLGPDSGNGVEATNVRLDENHDNCVIAGFENGTDLKSYTVAAVEGGVVKNRDGQKNIADSVSLDNARSTNNRTSGPDLVRVKLSKNLNRAQFIFDENLEKGSGNAGDFGFYSKAGGYHTGSNVVSVYNKTVTVSFNTNDQVDTAQRFVVTGGAIQDASGTANVLGTTSGRTDAADLTSVSRDSSDTEYTYKFDENVDNLSASDFLLYTNDGTEIQADDITTDGDEVHASFSRDIEDYPKDIVLAAINSSDDSANGDNTSDSSDGDTPTIGAVSVRSSNVTRSGRTTGPDLVSVSKNADDRRITLTFDEKLDDGDNTTDASGIYLATSDNRLVEADRILSIDNKKVYVKADKTDIKSLVGVVIESGAVSDEAGNDNPLTTKVWGSGDVDNGSSSSLYSNSST